MQGAKKVEPVYGPLSRSCATVQKPNDSKTNGATETEKTTRHPTPATATQNEPLKEINPFLGGLGLEKCNHVETRMLADTR